MTYPPEPPGGFPPNSYPPPAPPPPERSPWSSPAVIVAIAAGVLILVGGVLAALVLIPGNNDNDATPGMDQSTITSTITHDGRTTTVTTEALTTTSTTPTVGRETPAIPGADVLGFTAGPRCNAADDQVIMAGQTSRSRVIICQVGTQTGRWYYKGAAPEGGIEIGFPTRSGDTFIARNQQVVYTVSPSQLIITDSGSVIADEPMIAYWASAS